MSELGEADEKWASSRSLKDRPQLSDEAASYVRGLIMTGQVRAGEYLRLDRLAEELGISATPIREALLALRGEGFVQLVPRRGFVVMELSRQDVEDVFFVQATLAGELTARAAERMTPDEFAEIERLQVHLETVVDRKGDSEEIELANHAFHKAINLAARSSKLAWFLHSAARYAPRVFYPTIQGWREASVEDHRLILAALRDGGSEASRAAMNEHMLHAGDLLIAHLQEIRDWT